MNIIRISTRIFPDKGGPAKQSFLLSKYCAKKGINVINIASLPKSIETSKKSIVNKNFRVYYLPFHAPPDNSNLLIKIIFFLRFFSYSLFKIIKIRKNHSIDLLHVHSPIPSGYIAFICSKIFKIPYIFTMHGLDYPNSLFLKFEIELSIKNSTKTIAVSKKISNYLENECNLTNIQWLPNGIESSKYYHIKTKKQKDSLIKDANLNHLLSKDDLIIVYVGYMFFYQKVIGMIDFLNAFSKLIDLLPSNHSKKNIKLLYIGEGPYSHLLKKKIVQSNLKENVFFTGKREDVKDILAFSDLLSLTSYIEGNPNVILEAMASKVPCIGSNVGDIKYMIGNTGFIVEPGNIEKIKEALQEFFNLSSSERQKMGEKAFNRIKNHFDINFLIKKLIKIYKNSI
jgi:glycosyltransferase involved in cell wall biosynthesis